MAKKAVKKTKEPQLTLGEKAYELIKEKVISAEYVPGQFLQEAQVANDLGLGRTPVHGALHRLKQEGLLDIIPRKGIIVQADSMSEVFLSLETRKLVEPFCASLCAERRTQEQFDKIEDICSQQEDNEKLSKQERMELDRKFHANIARASGNHLLSDFLAGIHTRMSRIWFLPTWHFHDYDLTNVEHRVILDAIRKGDSQASASAMADHIESLSRRIMSAKPG